MPLHQGALVVSELEQLNVCDLEQAESMSREVVARASSVGLSAFFELTAGPRTRTAHGAAAALRSVCFSDSAALSPETSRERARGPETPCRRNGNGRGSYFPSRGYRCGG